MCGWQGARRNKDDRNVGWQDLKSYWQGGMNGWIWQGENKQEYTYNILSR